MRERQTDRQRQRQTDRQTDRQRQERQKQRHSESTHNMLACHPVISASTDYIIALKTDR